MKTNEPNVIQPFLHGYPSTPVPAEDRILPARAGRKWPWVMLFSRIMLFAGIQAFIAFAFYITGMASPWEASANWWPLAVSLANLICIILLVQMFKARGKRYWDIFRIQREHIKSDGLALLGILLIAGPVAFLPNILLARWLFGDPEATLDLLIRPLPFLVVYASIFLFAITQGLAEIPTYFSFVMPRFEAQGMRPWMALALPALLLSLQHAAVPLLFDARYLIWRGLMFLPFAFLVGLVIHWRPRLLPYLALVHVLMDMSFAMMLLGAAY